MHCRRRSRFAGTWRTRGRGPHDIRAGRNPAERKRPASRSGAEPDGKVRDRHRGVDQLHARRGRGPLGVDHGAGYGCGRQDLQLDVDVTSGCVVSQTSRATRPNDKRMVTSLRQRSLAQCWPNHSQISSSGPAYRSSSSHRRRRRARALRLAMKARRARPRMPSQTADALVTTGIQLVHRR